ncbi:MAG: crotonase/enoyl-CoA hydratase family protein [Thermoleophilaceae bacterium]|nr:crotonase/enoyl-CoA hydratase family protein [Thermoleophilaceae bacterium]
MSDSVLLEVRDHVAYVTLNRPEKLNGLDLPMLKGLVDASRSIAADREIRAAIVQGAGAAFSSGLDFAAVGKQPARVARAFFKFPGQTTNLFQRACWEWRELPVPVIAVTHGRCYGGAMQLALAADFRITTPDCEFSIMEGKWGLIPDMTGSVTLRELVPMDVAKRLTMTAESIDGLRAKELGLVTEVSDQPLRDAETLIAQISTRSPDSVAATKELLHKTWHRSPRAAFWSESRLQLRLLRGANHKIARAANFSKSDPQFRARKH